MLKYTELSSLYYIKITFLQELHSLSPFQSVTSQESGTSVNCTSCFLAMVVLQQGGHLNRGFSYTVGDSLTSEWMLQTKYD